MMNKQRPTYLSGADFKALRVSLFLLALFLGALSCGGPQSGGARKSCVPSDLIYVPMERGVYLEWRPNCGQSRAINGYNFYVTPAAGASGDFPSRVPHNSVPYPGDTDGDRALETAELKELESGIEYLAAVRILFPDGSESKPSNVVRFITMPSGKFTLAGRYQGDNDGYALARGEYVRADNSANDLYFMARADGDYLLSPSKLGFGLKTVRLAKVGQYSSLAESTRADSPDGGAQEIKVKAGDVIELYTEDNHYARVYIKALRGKDKKRTIDIAYMYNSIAGNNQF